MISKSKYARFIATLPALIVLLALGSGLPVSAQATKDPWTTPINLSNSGSTNNPVAVQDSNGIIHVIWQDKYAQIGASVSSGYVYSRLEGGNWSQPVSLPFPFGDTPPRLLADSKGFLHAFWIDQDGSLAYAHLTPKPGGLTFDKTQFIAEAALSFDVTIDAKDNIHVAYVRPKDVPGVPAGIYQRQSLDGGISWGTGDLIYPSPYFRGLDSKDANVSIASAQDNVYVAWDNKPRKRVFFSMSSDDGSSWSDPKEIQGADASLGFAGPYGIEVGAFKDNVLLLWQTGDPTSTCRQSYQRSTDGGKTWENPRTMLAEFYGCPQGNHLLSDNKGLIFLLTSLQDQLYLSVWDGSQWSKPEFERTLTGFEDPDTHDMVLYACQQPSLLQDGQMFVVGCDQGNGGDIWATSRPVSDVKSWFPPAPTWSQPETIGDSKYGIASLLSIADSQGNFHVMWTRLQDQSGVANGSQPKQVIYYAQKNADGWSQPVNILSSPDGDADELSIAVDNKDRLLAVWREKQSGNIYFSWASAARANSSSEWSQPQALPVVEPLATSPTIQVDGSGTIYVGYAIPINENRGIYITASTDGGETWSKPTRAVDAAAAQWEMVDQPQLGITNDGHLHLVWKPFTIVGVNGPLGVYYAQSGDAGLTWSQPESMVDAPVYWSDLVTSGEKNIDLIWQEKTFKGFDMKHRLSQDGGLNWERAINIASFGSEPVPATLTADSKGRVYLEVIDQDTSGALILKQWTWDGQRWGEEDGLDLSSDPTLGIPLMDSALSPMSRLGVVYSLEETSNTGGNPSNKLEYTDRQLILTETAASLTPTPTNEPTSTPAVTPTVPATPTPPPTLAPPVASTIPPVSGRSTQQLILGVGMVLVVAAVAGGLIARVLVRRGVSGS